MADGEEHRESAAEAVSNAAAASDPYERERQTFPKLTDEQIERVCRYGEIEAVPAGTTLFERGDRGADFFLVIEGSVEIFDLDDGGEPNVFTVHRAGQFTGELDLFNQREILVGGRTGEDSRLLRLDRDAFNRMYATEQDVGEIIMRAFILRRTAFILHDQAGVTLIGREHESRLLRMARFLDRNGYPYRVMIKGRDETTDYAGECGVDMERLPAVRTPDGQVFHDPELIELADKLGLTEAFDAGHVFDLAVIGAGPSGLSACVYAASENLDTLVIEAEAPGGQAGTSSKIENYLGFPTGISGQALAGRAWIQGQKFGARFSVARRATRIEKDGARFCIDLEDDKRVCARAVVLACGATYRKLRLDNLERYEGQGIHYAATALEAQFCKGTEVVVVGGGNSAGQAAVFLSGHAEHVHVLIRSGSLADSMSDYLVRRIDQSPRITLHRHTEVEALHGERVLEAVTWRDNGSGEAERRTISNMFVMIGAVPNTDWMEDCVELDDKGFVLTGRNGDGSPFETSAPGVFAVGDVRSGSVKRVASGVGEGSVCVSWIHKYLAAREEEDSPAEDEAAA